MATVYFTASFLSQTTNAALPDWTNIGTGIQATLSPTFSTETATLRGTYTFPGVVVINSLYSTLTGTLVAGGATSASVTQNGTSYGPYASTIGPQSNSSPTYSVSGNVLTVDITVQGSNYTGAAATMTLDNQTVVVDYTLIPGLHNLGVNF